MKFQIAPKKNLKFLFKTKKLTLKAYPPEPKNLTVYYLDQTSIKLRWNQIDNYDKSVVQYKLECFKCIDPNISTQTTPKSSTTSSSSSSSTSRTNGCYERQSCESYIEMTPHSDNLFDNKVTLSSLDSDTTYVLELHAEHVHGAFKTKTVDVTIRTLTPLSGLLVRNLSAYQFVDMNQILVMWSVGGLDSSDITAYEIRYWPRESVEKANVIGIRAPAQNFTFKNSNPNVISSTQYVFQMRARTSRGWTAYTEPPSEAVKISSVSFFYARDPLFMNASAPFYANWMATKQVAMSGVGAFTPMITPSEQFVSINMQSINGKI